VEDEGEGIGAGTADDVCGGSVVDSTTSAVVVGVVTGVVRIVEVVVS
jgi:hypothetical protein